MKITLIPAAELTGEHVEAWSEIQRSNAQIDSPYFRPEFTQAVAKVRNDMEVAVLQQQGAMVGFFPFQRFRPRVGRPVGGRMSDFHGVILGKDVPWDAGELLEGCGLKTWHFDHAVASQAPLAPYHRLVEDSPYAELAGGFAGYCARRGRRVENPFPRLATHARKLAREVGNLKFELNTSDQRVFDTLLQWKQQQYLRTGINNTFSFSWTRTLLEQIWRQQNEAFCGLVSALYAGDRLVAVRFSLRSYGVLHHWFPAYDMTYSKYSPGSICDLEMMKLVGEMGITRIDFGKGMNEKKSELMTGASQVAVGSVDLRPLTRVARRQWHRAYQWARTTPLRKPGRLPAHLLYRLREWIAYQ